MLQSCNNLSLVFNFNYHGDCIISVDSETGAVIDCFNQRYLCCQCLQRKICVCESMNFNTKHDVDHCLKMRIKLPAEIRGFELPCSSVVRYVP